MLGIKTVIKWSSGRLATNKKQETFMTKQQLLELRLQVDQIDEYLQTEICHKCEEMRLALIAIKQKLRQFSEETCD